METEVVATEERESAGACACFRSSFLWFFSSTKRRLSSMAFLRFNLTSSVRSRALTVSSDIFFKASLSSWLKSLLPAALAIAAFSCFRSSKAFFSHNSRSCATDWKAGSSGTASGWGSPSQNLFDPTAASCSFQDFCSKSTRNRSLLPDTRPAMI